VSRMSGIREKALYAYLRLADVHGKFPGVPNAVDSKLTAQGPLPNSSKTSASFSYHRLPPSQRLGPTGDFERDGKAVKKKNPMEAPSW